MRALPLLLSCLLLVGCSKRMETRVAGTEDEQIATHEARLEELRARGSVRDATCEDQCLLSTETCSVADSLCEVVLRQEGRPDLPRRCARARESCAERMDTCARCRARGGD